ncbi:TPA: hypothetical protein PDJ70_002703 [Staphylococcus aureus]|uniref:VOC family protein n=1 Tax=Staphylococcus coagulans TaxID=74706 RepID=UPI0030EC2BC9|nr:hypothetical protein [Staphylococcus aureus]
MKVTNLRLLTNNYQTMFHFYNDKLKLECMYGDLDSNYADFKFGDIYLSLFNKKAMMSVLNFKENDEFKNFQQAIIIKVDDLHATYDYVSKITNIITKPTERIEWGINCFHIVDPDENILEFYTDI